MRNNGGVAGIEEAVAAIRRGEIVVVIDDENRENEGDLIMAAQFATPESIAFFVRYTSGVICTPLTAERTRELGLDLMVAINTGLHATAFTVSVDYRPATTTGISAADRAVTIRALADDRTIASDFAKPGHVFPLRAAVGGVLKRAGHTEAAVDLVAMAGLYPAGVICELVNDDGSMMRVPDLEAFCSEHSLLMVSIADLIRYRRQRERLIRLRSHARMPTRAGEFECYAYEAVLDGTTHVALVCGDVAGQEDVLVRVHSECLTGDVFGSVRCDCGPQLETAMQMVAAEGRGVIVYMRGHEGRGIGLAEKVGAYALQDQGRDTVDANLDLGLPVDSREYGIGAQILVDLGITTMRLLTNNPSKRGGLEGFGLEVTGQVPIVTQPTLQNIGYLRTKRDRMGHALEGLG